MAPGVTPVAGIGEAIAQVDLRDLLKTYLQARLQAGGPYDAEVRAVRSYVGPLGHWCRAVGARVQGCKCGWFVDRAVGAVVY